MVRPCYGPGTDGNGVHGQDGTGFFVDVVARNTGVAGRRLHMCFYCCLLDVLREKSKLRGLFLDTTPRTRKEELESE